MPRKSKLNLSIAVIVMVLVAVLGLCGAAFAAEGRTNITILHVNDVHGRMEAFVPSGGTDKIGGMTKIAAYVEELRKDPEANLLLLSAGDMVHGTNIVNLFSGIPMIEAMNEIGFAAMALGNHEFNYGQEPLKALEAAANFPFLATNVVYSDSGEGFVKDSFITEIDGIKIGIFGLSPLETPIVTHPKNVIGLKFADPIETAKAIVPELRAEADIVLCISHLGHAADSDLATAVPGIDIIVGGHSHTEVPQPELVGKTIVVQAGEWAKYLGMLEIEVVDGKIESYNGQLVAMDATVPSSGPDAAIEAIIGGYNQALEDKMAAVVGHTEVALDGERAHVRTGTTNLANLITDAMRGAAGADIVITNGGGIRASISAGDITMGDIYTVLPFDNTLVVIELSGKDILAALEHGIGSYPSQAGSFAQVSGLTFTFDPSKPAGSRIVEVLVDGEPLDADRLYAVATNDFMAAGGDGYVWFAEASILFDSGEMLRDVVAGYLAEQEGVEASSEIRIVPIQ